MILSDLNYLEPVVEESKIVGGLVFVSINKYSNLTVVNQAALAVAKNESIYGYGGGASAYASNYANVYS